MSEAKHTPKSWHETQLEHAHWVKVGPALLEALEACVDMMENESPGAYMKAEAQARAAIALAKGEA